MTQLVRSRVKDTVQTAHCAMQHPWYVSYQTLQKRMAALGCSAKGTDQGDSNICVCSAIAMAVIDGNCSAYVLHLYPVNILTINGWLKAMYPDITLALFITTKQSITPYKSNFQDLMTKVSMPHKINCKHFWWTQATGWENLLKVDN